MSGIKGYPTQEKDDRLKAEFATVEPIKEHQHGMSVVAHIYTYQVGTDTVEANSTTTVINATAHAAKKGDVIRLTSGTLSGTEFKVFDTTANTITICETLPSAPANGVNFEILRHKYPKILSDGSLSVGGGAVQFIKDSSAVSVTEDTITPANNLPLPVKLTSVTGDINITAGDLNVQLSHAGGSYDSTRIGDGTDLLDVSVAGSATPTNGLMAHGSDGTNARALKTDSSGELQIDVLSSALPTGASTLAEQQTQTTHLGQIETAVELIDDTVATAGSAITTKAIAMAGSDGTDARILKTDASGELQIDVLSSALPTGAATAANQTTGNSSLSSIDGKIPSNLTVTSTRLLVDGSGVTQPISSNAIASLAAPAPSLGVYVAGIDTLGDLRGIAVENSGFVKISDGSGSLTVDATNLDIRDLSSSSDSIAAVQSGTWNINNVSGTVSLPTGASTLAEQQTQSTSLSSIDGKIPANLTVTSTRLLVDGSGVTQPVSATNLDIRDLSSATDSVAATQSGTWTVQPGNTANTTPWLVRESGRTVVTTTRNDYSSVNVTSGAWVQLIASTSAEINSFEIFDSSGQTLELGTGGSGSETRLILVFPGGNGLVRAQIASGTRISIRAVSATANSGEIDINWFS